MSVLYYMLLCLFPGSLQKDKEEISKFAKYLLCVVQSAVIGGSDTPRFLFG